jgi:beta-phosphoglucomutase-like phosphatase (HAD superfamily)
MEQAEATTTLSEIEDLEGTLVDSVYQHVLAWREALEKTGIELAVWRIHRRISSAHGLSRPNPARRRCEPLR